MLSTKAEKLLQALQNRGGGSIDEYFLRDDTGLSHGSIVAARWELEAAGLLTLSKQGRKLVYTLTGQKPAPMTTPAVNDQPTDNSQRAMTKDLTAAHNAATGQPAGGNPAPAPPAHRTNIPPEPAPASDDTGSDSDKQADTAAASFLPAMPHIAGTFYDFDEWTDALMNALGACLYISEDLRGDGTYTVYSHEYEGEDTYQTEMTEDGFIVN